MRTKFYLLAFIMMCIGGIAFAAIHGDGEVDLGPRGGEEGGGGNGGNPPKSGRIIPIKPVKAFLIQNETMEVTFFEIFGIVTVEIKDETGNVCIATNVNTALSAKEMIDVTALTPGTYTISFKDATGALKYYYGDFEID
ncbi:DUF3244 domain-containing protein [Prevotella sp. 10(H)]|uniref:DUF3244 domain-containing protein n=1 Tax=Prevotella sp. 10(H) TaxID=1158294 RepID=UPI0004A6DC61|nr:DUF3244 domain-containing protein [Prevotella sp. 10(H)]